MSRAWYKPKAVPQLLESFSSHPTTTNSRLLRDVQVWNTTCAVTKSGSTSSMACSVLINPANPQLSGVSKFPYFPRGGPVPARAPQKDSHPTMGYVTQWGGMEVGTGMLFSANVVDGLVHQLGGWRLALECRCLPILNRSNNSSNTEEERCPVGHAVVTGPGPGSELQEHFDSIVHTVPPFYQHHADPEHYLLQAYKNALAVAFDHGSRVACPLLGAGGRGFPLDVAIRLAGKASIHWLEDQSITDDNNNNKALAFAIPDIEVAEQLVESIKAAERSRS